MRNSPVRRPSRYFQNEESYSIRSLIVKYPLPTDINKRNIKSKKERSNGRAKLSLNGNVLLDAAMSQTIIGTVVGMNLN